MSRSRSISKGSDGRRRLHRVAAPAVTHPPHQHRRKRSRSDASGTASAASASVPRRSGESSDASASRKGRSASTSRATRSLEIRTNHLFAAFPDSAPPPRPSNPSPYSTRPRHRTPTPNGDGVGRVARAEHAAAPARVHDSAPLAMGSATRPSIDASRAPTATSVQTRPRTTTPPPPASPPSWPLQFERESPASHKPDSPHPDSAIEISPVMPIHRSRSQRTQSPAHFSSEPRSPTTPDSPTQGQPGPPLRNPARALPNRPRKKSSSPTPPTLPSIAAIVAPASPSPAAIRDRTTHTPSAAPTPTSHPVFPPPVRLLPHSPAARLPSPLFSRPRPAPLPLPSTTAVPRLRRHSSSSTLASSRPTSIASSSRTSLLATPGPTLSAFPSLSAFPKPGASPSAADTFAGQAYVAVGAAPWDREHGSGMSVPLVLEASGAFGFGAGAAKGGEAEGEARLREMLPRGMVVDGGLRRMGMGLLRGAEGMGEWE